MSIAQGPSTPTTPRQPGRHALPERLRTRWETWRARRRLSPQTALEREVERSAAAQQRNGALAPEPVGWLGWARRWSPGLVPPAIGAALLYVVAQLAAQRTWRGDPLIAPNALTPLLIFYVVAGLLFGATLYMAPTAAGWMVTLVAGLALYPLVTAAFIWGWPGTLIVGMVIAICVFLYARRRIVTVPDHQAQITRLGRAYFRTLRPGVSVLLPGERTFIELDTAQRAFVTPPRQVRIESAEGVIYAPRATAEVAYHLVPTRAHLALLASDRWEEDVRAAAARALDDALADWAIQLLDEVEPPAERYLARTILVRLREVARPWGVHVDTVKVQQIRMLPEPESEVIPAEWAPVARTPRAASVPAIGERLELHPLATPPYVPAPREARPPATRMEAPPLPEDLAPEALSDAYDEVRVGHITDPIIIRRIARAFQAVAADPSLNDGYPYDAATAARILLDLAASLDGQSSTR